MTTQLITDLENTFGSKIWDPLSNRNYRINPQDVIKLFQIYNKNVFDGKIAPMTLKIRSSQTPTLAAFEFGVVKSQPVCMYIFNAAIPTSFFMLMNNVAHEMIHAYDWHVGPINELYRRLGIFNYDPDAESIANPGHPTQVVFDPRFPDYRSALAAGKKVYDCHGRWFKAQAEKFNSNGFDVVDVFDQFTAKPALRRVDEDPDETPEDLRYIADDNPVKTLFNSIKNIDHKSMVYRDPENWFIEIS